MLLALIAAYAATTASSFGDATRSAGSAADKVYSKTLELNEQYDLLPKAKSAPDAVTTAAVNIDRNYGISGKIDDQLKISQAVDKATGSFNDFKGSVTDKVTELKRSTESSD